MIELTPSRHAHKEVQPYPFPSNYKEVLRISSPAVPPGLLKMHTKRTDGKVDVIVSLIRENQKRGLGRAFAELFALCCWESLITLAVPHSTQEYQRVLVAVR